MLLYISWENLSLYKKRILWPLHLPIPITFLLDNILHITRRPCIVASEVVHRRSLFNDLYLLVFPCFCKQYVYKLNIPIHRVPTSKSSVFCKGMEFPFFQHLTVSWAVPVAKKIFLKKCYASECRSKRRWNGSAQVKLFRSKWSSLTGRSGPTENCRSIFKNFRFQSRSSSSLHIVVKMADGSDGSVY